MLAKPRQLGPVLPSPCVRPCLERLGPAASRRAQVGTWAASSDGKPASASAQELLKETEELLRRLSSDQHHEVPLPSDGYLSDDDHFSSEPAFEVTCDVNGCIITPVAPRASSPTAASMAAKDTTSSGSTAVELHEGPGWKLVLDKSGSTDSPFDALIGSDKWAIAVTRAELVDFLQLLLNLRQSVATLDICGEWGSNEEATLEMQSGSVYVQGRAPQNRLSALQDLWKGGEASEGTDVAFELQFSIRSPASREVEAYWPADVVMSVFQFLDSKDGWLEEVQLPGEAQVAA